MDGNYLVTFCLAAVLAIGGCAEPEDAEILFDRGDYEDAYALFSERAAAGDPGAQNFVGVHYYLGLGVDRDYARAGEWFERAAVGRHSGAARNLGMLYMRGLGVEKDNMRAYAWFFHAYEDGDPSALKYLRAVSDLITPNQTIKARKWMRDYLRQAENSRS